MYNDDDFNEEEVENSNQSQNKFLDFYYANKKLIWILLAIILFILVFSLILGGSDNNKPINNGIVVEMTSLSEKISIGNSKKLYATVKNKKNAIIVWSSSDPSVATVDANTGIIKGINYGVAIITATYVDSDNKPYTAKCEVVVSKGDLNIKITSVEFPEGELMMSVGNEYLLPTSFKPDNGYITNIKYTSYNKDVVEVNEQSGLVKALKVGKATITLEVNDGQIKNDIDVHVVEENIISQIVVNPTKIEFNDPLLPVEVGGIYDLDYDYSPDNVTISNLNWTSSDPTIATVENGRVKGLKEGETVITVTALNGKNAMMTVKVIPKYIPVESVEIISDDDVTLTVGGVHTIIANVNPGDASNKNKTFNSSNTSVATVDNEGLVKAIGAGTAVITVTTEDGNKKATVNVTVQKSSSGSTGGSSGGSYGGGSSGSGIGSLMYNDKNGETAKIKSSLEKVKAINYQLPITISINKSPITKVDICAAKCEDDECKNATCTKKSYTSFPFDLEVPNEGAGLYVIKATKCANDNCAEVQDNYFYLASGATDNQINVNWNFKQRFYVLTMGNVNEGYVSIKSPKKIKKVFYCYELPGVNKKCSSIGAIELTDSFESAYKPNWCNGGYIGYNKGTTYEYPISSSFNSQNLHFCAYEENNIILTFQYEDGNWERKQVYPKQP